MSMTALATAARALRVLCAMAALSTIVAAPATGAPTSVSESPVATITERTAGLQHLPGLLPLHWDAKRARLFLEIPRLDSDLLYVDSLPYGLGSNDVGLDRGQLARSRVVRFERYGPKILLIERNEFFRSSASAAAERLAVRESFPESTLASFTVLAEDGTGAVLVDATEFFERDAHRVVESLAAAHQDGYKLDATLSVIVPEALRAFPQNIEVESMLTFVADAPEKSRFVADVTPDAHALTLREHQSFIALPGPGFEPRRYDPRAGYFDQPYRDYSAALGEPLTQHWIVRHRLRKQDPNCQSACVAERPIQYYVDRGAPEPVRSALVDGARWWDEAFQAAGWAPGTFKVDVLPEGADPMDVRYNMIQWVHRYTRGWSYGDAVADPRTGEIIKGNVTLGSLRGRQDYLIAEAVLSPYVTGARLDPAKDPMLAMALARLRQLAAHETGHTLGLAHNFAASSFPHTPQESVSVMDYPHPWITLDAAGVPTLAQAYAVGIGQWDKVAIDYGYREFPANADTAAALTKILADSARTGLQFITDEDARPLGGAHPHAHLWDNGPDPAAELERIMTIRAAALRRFGQNAIRTGQPVAGLEDTLVPLYLLHRYQTEAAIKEIGGLDYRYAVRGDDAIAPTIVASVEQRKALHAVLQTLTPEFLTLPESLLEQLPPRPPELERTPESFPAHTGLTFDPVAAAECAADLTLAGLFNAERAARLLEYRARDGRNPALLGEVIDAALATTAAPRDATAPATLSTLVAQAVRIRTVEALLTLAANPRASAPVRALAYAKLQALRQHGDPGSATDQYLASRIDSFARDPGKFQPSPPTAAPPGMPIGDWEE